jgi:hypothetical protein
MMFVVDNNGSGGVDSSGVGLPARAPSNFEACPPCVVVFSNSAAEHFESPLRLTFKAKNTTYSLWQSAGGGGGHQLAVRRCAITVLEFCAHSG